MDHWGTFCAGGNPNVHFFPPAVSDYQVDTLPPNHAAPLLVNVTFPGYMDHIIVYIQTTVHNFIDFIERK